MKFNIRLEFKLEDFWIGVFWRHKKDPDPLKVIKLQSSYSDVINTVTDIWICLIPCLPIHITVYRYYDPLQLINLNRENIMSFGV